MNFTPDQVLYWGPRVICGLPLLLAVNFVRKHWRICGRRFGSTQ